MTAHQGRVLSVGVLLFYACLAPGLAHAYIGPAIAFIGYLLGPVAAVIAAIGIVLYLPVKMLLKKWKKSTPAAANDSAE